MISFKPKPEKVIKFNKKSAVTLDSKHKEILQEFSKQHGTVLPQLRAEKRELRQTLRDCEKGTITLSIEQRMDVQDRLQDVTEEIRRLSQSEKNYFLDNSKYIFEYFETKKNIGSAKSGAAAGDNTNTSVASRPVNHVKNKMLASFFKVKETAGGSATATTTDTTANAETTFTTAAAGTAEDSMFSGRDTANIVQKYLRNIDEEFFDLNAFVYPTDVCGYCRQGEMIPLEDEGQMVCNQCARTAQYLTENEKPSYKEPPKEVCFYAYKRINHFKEILAQFQGKETTQIPPAVIDNIRFQIRKERISLDELNYAKTKEILKKLGYNKLYEHITFIRAKLGVQPPVMSPELEETLCNLFVELQGPYSKYCPDDRVNFLNYNYTAYKLCELLGETQYLPLFPMLKDEHKKTEQDFIWKLICADLHWEFKPTI